MVDLFVERFTDLPHRERYWSALMWLTIQELNLFGTRGQT